ncbi:MAG: S8 family serine peptidase [Chitinophagaceae bacterium]|nr:S8 family serine peptidase [Chitinophagaceae bacterium]
MESKTNKDKRNGESICFRLIVKFYDHLCFPYHDAKEINEFFLHHDIISWQQLLNIFQGIKINKLFTSLIPDQIIAWVDKASKSDSTYKPPDFFSYYSISWTCEINTRELLRRLRKDKNVELAYLQNGPLHPPSVRALHDDTMHTLNSYQEYLNPSPQGINARYAWGVHGGDGQGSVQFIDIEQGWIEDHKSIFIKRLTTTGINCEKFKDHGSAVLGVIMMQDKEIGGQGITPKAKGHIISQWRPDGTLNTADAIVAAIDHLRFGDILLLEAQVSDTTPANRLWPVELEEATYQAIRLATALGITVIEAAGNGNLASTKGNNMDFFRLRGKEILNPESLDFRDSGAVIVAAASSTSPHKRRKNSNYGKRINCYGWGDNVVTAGSYPRSSGTARNRYTMNFSGTSSAAAIITGVAISVQCIMEAKQKRRLGPIEMRAILSNDLYGTPSANGRLVNKIGVMPDLKKIIDNALK